MARTDRVRYVPHRKDMRRLMRSEGIAKVCEKAAENAKAYAEGIAPRDTGKYADSFEVETRTVRERQTAVLFNTVKYATVLEIQHRVLGRAADHAKP